jgi:SHS2 domain-containing protein
VVSRPRFRTLAHRADVRVAVWGADEEELIRNALAAACTVALGRIPSPTARRWAPIARWPADLPSQLVRAVNEALFHLYARRELAVGFELRPGGARLAVAPLPPGRRPDLEVKAATYHDLRPRRRVRRLAALITLDV